MATLTSQIKVRHPKFDMSGLKKYWVNNNPIVTHFANAWHVFGPYGEQFFIDTVNGYKSNVEDKELQDRIRAFIGQEAWHKVAHQRVWDTLSRQGAPIDNFKAFNEIMYVVISKLPMKIKLAMTAAAEHYTASLADSLFADPTLEERIHPEMLKLILWHAVEELEHKAVAFDVLATAEDSYITRMAGFFIASILIWTIPAVGFAQFVFADKDLRKFSLGDLFGHFKILGGEVVPSFTNNLLKYFRFDFHPDQIQDPDAAVEFINKLENEITKSA